MPRPPGWHLLPGDFNAMTPQPPIPAGIRSECGRARYLDLAARPGPLAKLRLLWFVAIASLRDRRLP
jgi:hypothetical protein